MSIYSLEISAEGQEVVQLNCMALRAHSCAEWRMVLVDLRNHGRSAGIKGFDPPHNMSTAAKDLADLVKARDWPWPDVVVGHSMGGKVALDFADSCSRGVYGQSAVLPKQVRELLLVSAQVVLQLFYCNPYILF